MGRFCMILFPCRRRTTAEQDVPAIAGRLPAVAIQAILQDSDAPLYGGTVMNALVPALDCRIIGELLPLPTIGTDPGVDCHVRDRIRAGEILGIPQAPLDHCVEAGRLASIAFDGVVDLLGSILAEMVGLAEHWAHSPHLKHQPLQDRVVISLAVRKELLAVSI